MPGIGLTSTRSPSRVSRGDVALPDAQNAGVTSTPGVALRGMACSGTATSVARRTPVSGALVAVELALFLSFARRVPPISPSTPPPSQSTPTTTPRPSATRTATRSALISPSAPSSPQAPSTSSSPKSITSLTRHRRPSRNSTPSLPTLPRCPQPQRAPKSHQRAS